MDASLNDENAKVTLQNGLDMVKNRDKETVNNLDNDIVKNPKTSELKVHFRKSTKENGNEEEKMTNCRTNLAEDDKINCVETSSDDRPDSKKEDDGLCAIDLIEAADHSSKAGDIEDEDQFPPVLQKVTLENDKASHEDSIQNNETVDGKKIDVLVEKEVNEKKQNINGEPEKPDAIMCDAKNCVEIESEVESDNSVELIDEKTKNGTSDEPNGKNTIDLQESFTSWEDNDIVEIVSDQVFDKDRNADSDQKNNDKSQPSAENLVREKSVIECCKKRGNGEHLDEKSNTTHSNDQVKCKEKPSVPDDKKETLSNKTSGNRDEPSDQSSFTVFEVGDSDSDHDNIIENAEKSSVIKGAKNASIVFEYRKDEEEFTVVAVDDEDDVAETNITKSPESSMNESGLSTESCTAKETQDTVKSSPDVAVDEKRDEVDISKASEIKSVIDIASTVVAATTPTAPSTSSASKVGAKNVDPLSFLPKHEALINNIFLKPVTCEMAKCLVGIGLDMVREQVYGETIKQVKTSNLPLTNSEKDSLKIVAEMRANVLKRIKYFKHSKKTCGCGFKSESRNVLALHREYGNSIDDLSFVCCLCTFRSRNSYSFVKHMNRVHRMSGRARPKLSKFSCNLCSYENQSQSSFWVHESKCKRQFNLCVNLLFSRTDCDIPLYAKAKPGEPKIATPPATKLAVTTAPQPVLKNLPLVATSKQKPLNMNLPSPTVPLLTRPLATLRTPLPIISSMSSFQSLMNTSTLAGLNSTSLQQPRFIQLGDRLYAPVVQPSGQILLTPLSLPTAPVNPLPPIPQFNSPLFNSLNKTNIPPISLDMDGFLRFEQQMKASQGMRPVGQSLQMGGQTGIQMGNPTMLISSPSIWPGSQSMQMSSRSMRPVGQSVQLNRPSPPQSRQSMRPVIPTQNRASRPPALSKAAVSQVATRQVRPTRQIPPLVRAPATNTNTRAPVNTKAPIRAAHNSRQIVIQPIADKQSTTTIYHVPAPPNYLICELCNGFVKDREALETHVRLVHKLSQDILDRVGEVCDLCLKKFYTRHGLLRHLRGDHSEDVLLIRPLACCPLCNSKTENDLVRHMSSKHQNMMAALLDAVRCSICFLKMRNQIEFENHMLTVHKEMFPERVVLLACIAASASKFLPDKTYPIDSNDVVPVVVIAPDTDDEPLEVSPITITPKTFTKHEIKKPEFKKLESSGGTGIIKPCYRCNASFPSLSKLQQHFHSVHASDKEPCTVCSEHIQIGRPYVRHVRARHLRECSVVLQRLKGYSDDSQSAGNVNVKKRRRRCKQFRNDSLLLNDCSLMSDEECSLAKKIKIDDEVVEKP